MLTDRQRYVLEVVKGFILEHGWPPTIRELGEALDISSTNGVRRHLEVLERKGFLSRDPGTARGLKIKETEIE